MDLADLRAYRNGVWLIDTEFSAPPGERDVIPVCLVAQEFFTGKRVWRFFEPGQAYANPFPLGRDSLFVSYAAQSEWNCFLSLGWELPVCILDLYAEFRNEVSGRPVPPGFKEHDVSMLGAMSYYRLDAMDAGKKDRMRERIIQGFPFTASERRKILVYCSKDVGCLQRLLPAMMPAINLRFALYRGRYTKAVAHIERIGFPLDHELYGRVIGHREILKSRLVSGYEKQNGQSPYVQNKKGACSFVLQKFEAILADLALLAVWRRTPKAKRPVKRADYLKKMAHEYPVLEPLAELIGHVEDLRSFALKVGTDGRARFQLMPWGTITSRNSPKAREFLLAQSNWTRGFMKPPPGYAIAALDWKAAEFGIAAQLSGDKGMQATYEGGDPYLSTAESVGFAKAGATKQSDPVARDVLKVWLLSVLYGATAKSLVKALPAALREKLPNPEAMAEEFIEKHHRIYARYWMWANGHTEIFRHETHVQETCFGWKNHLDEGMSEWAIRNRALNFPMQSTCAEILRWSVVYCVEVGLPVVASLHNALYVSGSIEEIDEIVHRTRECMNHASEMVLGSVLLSDVKIFRYPERLMESRGKETWNFIVRSLEEIESEPECQPILETQSQSEGGNLWV